MCLCVDEEKFEVQLTSDLNSKIRQILPSLEDHQRKLKKLIENILDRKVAKTDMKLRHIVTKGIEVTNSELSFCFLPPTRICIKKTKTKQLTHIHVVSLARTVQ